VPTDLRGPSADFRKGHVPQLVRPVAFIAHSFLYLPRKSLPSTVHARGLTGQMGQLLPAEGGAQGQTCQSIVQPISSTVSTSPCLSLLFNFDQYVSLKQTSYRLLLLPNGLMRMSPEKGEIFLIEIDSSTGTRILIRKYFQSISGVCQGRNVQASRFGMSLAPLYSPMFIIEIASGIPHTSSI
jgi:hypothetical protein